MLCFVSGLFTQLYDYEIPPNCQEHWLPDTLLGRAPEWSHMSYAIEIQCEFIGGIHLLCTHVQVPYTRCFARAWGSKMSKFLPPRRFQAYEGNITLGRNLEEKVDV